MFSAFFPIFFTMLIVVDPIGLVPLYIGLTSRIAPEKRKGIIRKAILVSFLVLLGFVFLGKYILALLHIEPGSFFIAGGIMLFIVALEMLFGRQSHTKISEKEHADPGHDDARHLAVFPLAIPMLAGPGAITTIILYAGSYVRGGREFSFPEIALMLVVAIILVLIITALTLTVSDFILMILGETGVSVMERIMGLLLAGLSVQFVYDGIVRLGFSRFI